MSSFKDLILHSKELSLGCFRTMLIIAFFIFASFASAKSVVILLQDSHKTLKTAEIDLMPDFFEKVISQDENARMLVRPKFVHLPLDNFATPEKIIEQLREKISAQDTVISFVVFAHGGPTQMHIDSNLYSGEQVGKIMADIASSFNFSKKLSFYFWSCKTGCKIGSISSFQEDFAISFTKQLGKSGALLDRLDVLSHMSITNGSGVQFQKSSVFNHLLLKSRITHVLGKVVSAATGSAKIREFFKKHKTINTIFLGNNFTPPMSIPAAAVGLVSFFTSLALYDSRPEISFALAVGGVFVATAVPYIFKQASRSLSSYVKRLSITNDFSFESYGYLSELLEETIKTQNISCKDTVL